MKKRIQLSMRGSLYLQVPSASVTWNRLCQRILARSAKQISVTLPPSRPRDSSLNLSYLVILGPFLH